MSRIEEICSRYPGSGAETIMKAWRFAAEILKDDLRGNGKPFLEHPLGVASIAAEEIGLQAECIAAVFLHEAQRLHPDAPLRDLGFDEAVYRMVDGLGRIATIRPKDTRLEAENYKKLLIQYSADPRIIVLKLADRLEVMRNLDLFPKSSRDQKVLETLMLYIPLAHQLGLYNMKREMEDIWLNYSEPEQYRLITNKLKATQKDRERLMEEFIAPLEKKLSDAGISYKLKIRTKAAYSIWMKMQKQHVPFEGVYDVFAIRFIIECDPSDRKKEKDLCWQVYSFVTEEYEADTSRLRDWLTTPKPNGYESLHVTVRNREGSSVEVQIRTRRMDEIAENGFASHWSYKGIRREESLDNWLAAARQSLENPGMETADDLPRPPRKEIFVFTPSGELRILPAGATVLDFAFNIHSLVGSRCTGGLVGGKPVPIKEKLHTGEVVEILTGKNQRPSPDWLGYVVTSKARTKIRQLINEEEHKKAADGKELLLRRLKNWKLDFPDEMLAEFMKKRHISSVNSFLAMISDKTLDVNEIKEYILGEDKRRAEAIEAAKAEEEARLSQRPAQENHDSILVIGARDIKGLDYKMAKCCNPVFGDDVFGFVTRGEGIKIHRMSCPNAARLLDQFPYRIQKVQWAESPSSGLSQATLKIIAAGEGDVLGKITEAVNRFKASIRSFNMNEDPRNGTWSITLRLSVASHLELDKVISQMREIRQIQKITRQ